jgi:opacity protein-like surface antigen
MKHAVSILAVCASILCTSAAARAAETDAGLYGTLRLGPSMLQDMNFAQASTANLSLDPSAGWALNGALGYSFGNGLRTEIDFGYGRNSLSGQFQENVQFAIPCGTVPSNPCLSPNVDGRAASISGFGMLLYDLPVQGPLRPYAGVGLGLVNVAMDVGARASMNNGTVSRHAILDASDTVIGYRGTLGVSYELGRTDLLLGYTYSSTARMDVPGRGAFVSFEFDRRYTAHTLSAGVRLKF